MATFITLTCKNGVKPRVNVDHITSYACNGESELTAVDVSDGTYSVTETPEQIDAMLGGVTESSQSAADIAAEPIKAMIREKRKLASSVVSAQVMSVLAVEAAVLEEAVKVIYAAFGAARGE